MAIKRRGFLAMLGGAFAAPLMPNVTVASVTKVGYPASALHAAIYHAKSRVNFSVFSLSRQLGLELGQAEQIMSDMSARGILGPLQGSTQSGRWALSKVWERPIVDAAAAQKVARTKRNSAGREVTQSAPQTAPTYAEPDLSRFLAHLHDICRSHGMPLHPRCTA